MPGETAAHRQLKHLAAEWARHEGFTGIASEVRLPKSAYRADVAAYKPARNQLGTTAVFECKQSRSDLLKDSYRRDATSMRLRQLDVRRQKLEELLKLHYPSLRSGDTLFAEFDAIHLAGFQHETYRRVLREIEILQRRLAGKTKFDKLTRYRCANLNYLVVEPDILAPEETPVGWGLLVRRDSVLTLVRVPQWQEVATGERLRLLENIAARARID
ncbi:MAG: hypothetical protein PCFJNLEI_02767 [Verrucomicrobiae bacterium]|nr:hypothetical protein [Verrucomicrobiae bacterium]